MEKDAPDLNSVDLGQPPFIATVKGVYGKGVIYYDHTDHLSGSAVVSDTSGRIMEMTDYYPYGTIRIHEQSFGSNEQRKYAGHEYDATTGLNYMRARYQDSRRGQFLSQDPSFIALDNKWDLHT